MKRKEPSYTVGRKVNWCSPDGAQYGGSLKKLKIELTYNSAIPLLSTGLKRNTVRRDHMHRNVHCSTVYNSQDMEATYLSIDREMDKKRGDTYIQRHSHTSSPPELSFSWPLQSDRFFLLPYLSVSPLGRTELCECKALVYSPLCPRDWDMFADGGT